MIRIAPSLLAANFLELGREIEKLEAAGADALHIDVMDGHFVPNLSMGPVLIEAIRRASKLPLDVHLMITNAEIYLERYANAGADSITVHIEACVHAERTIKAIKALKCKAQLAINPSTPESCLSYLIDDLDLILVMSVNPGFSGQTFIPSALKKIRAIKAMLDLSANKSCLIGVDGGINKETLAQCFHAGASYFVAGAAILHEDDYGRAIQSLRSIS
jgi:ribulose-phosphate 3-epimerase